MKYQIRTNEVGRAFVTPVDGDQAGKTWNVGFDSPESAKEAILTVSRVGKIQQRFIPEYAIDD